MGMVAGGKSVCRVQGVLGSCGQRQMVGLDTQLAQSVSSLYMLSNSIHVYLAG